MVGAGDGELKLVDVREGEVVMTANGVEGSCLSRVTRCGPWK